MEHIADYIIGITAEYQTRYTIALQKSSPSIYWLRIWTLKLDGTPYTSPVTFSKIKVIFAEASTIISAQANGTVNLNNYQTVKAALSLKD